MLCWVLGGTDPETVKPPVNGHLEEGQGLGSESWGAQHKDELSPIGLDIGFSSQCYGVQ
jgi:hypothetical protein